MGNIANSFLDEALVQKPGCMLQVSGIGFSPESFLEKSSFASTQIIFKGKLSIPNNLKPKIAVAQEPADILQMSFLIIKVSDAKIASTQLEQAISFLKQYQNEFQVLRTFPKVETILIHFLSEQNKLLNILQVMPTEFLELCFKYGIQSSFSDNTISEI